MVASTEWEAISQAFFFGSPATGMGMQGAGPLPGAGAGSPGRRGRPGVGAGPSPLSERHARDLLGLLGVPVTPACRPAS